MSSKRSFFVTAVEIYHRTIRDHVGGSKIPPTVRECVKQKSGTFRKIDGETNTRLLSACGQVGHLCCSQRILLANESGRGTLSVRWNGVRQQRTSIGRLRPFLRSC
jgi:hypothetical protein